MTRGRTFMTIVMAADRPLRVAPRRATPFSLYFREYLAAHSKGAFRMTVRYAHAAFIAALAAAACTTPALGADANAGKQFFRAQCALCHSAEANDNGGAQGPSLNGVFGREAAGSADFGYTQAMR